MFVAAQARWSAQDIFLFVGAFGAMGHHLPGMIRAYGDKALFQRFRMRFVVAPVVLIAVCVWSSVYNIQAIQLVALVWGIWHGMMQTYGFSRIYDGKARAKAPQRARLDFALCLTWFTTAVVLSPLRFRSCLDLYYDSGGPVIPSWLVNGFRSGAFLILSVVTVLYAVGQWRDWRAGRGFSPIKLALLASSIGFWWYCNNGVQNILVGIALFEVFHDVQYLSIVWIYNRARVERDETIRGFMRFVFRRSGSLLGVYVGLVFAYGAIALLTSGVSAEAIRYTLVGMVTASALLHFYYDGFIWKVRETQTGSMLGLNSERSPTAPQVRRLPPWSGHALRWAALLVPFGALCGAQLLGRTVPAIERSARVAEVLPQDGKAQLAYGKALQDAGRLDDAIGRLETAVRLKPDLAEAEFCLGLALSDRGDLTQSVPHYERALELDPKNAKTEVNLAGVLRVLRRPSESRARYEHSLALDPKLELAHKELADLLLEAGEYDNAIAHYEEALRLQPAFPEAVDGLRFARSFTGR
ncbi:MAG: tetratricopeptide repeat protein [Chthoniobacterales bacterium]